MIIECPQCHTRFRLDPTQLSDRRAMLKCARCQHLFSPPGSPPPTRVRPKTPSSEERNLSFAFDDDDWRASDPAPDDLAEEQFLLNAAERDVPPDQPPAPTAAARPRREEAELVRGDDDFADDPPADDVRAVRRSGGISLRSVFVFLVLVVCAYGTLTWTLLDDPDWAARLTRTLPVIGKEVRERAVGQDIALIDVQGRYERTKEGKLVFLITGKAVNHSAEVLHGVQIASRLYGANAQPVDEQVITCGNPMEAKLGDLSIHQVAILRGIKPPSDAGVLPGAQCPFVAIFLEVPSTVGSFSAEAVRAQRQA